MVSRVFLAIILPDDIKQILKDKQTEISNLFDYDPVNWTSFSNLHITIHFFGNKSEVEIKNLIEAIKSLNIKSFDIEFDKICYGPDKENPRMIWAKLKQNENINKIRSIFSNQDYMPHITLGRISSFKASQTSYFPDIDDDIEFEFKANQIALMQSNLSSRGAKYKSIEVFNLS
jgi:2'-5' RNA ligase